MYSQTRHLTPYSNSQVMFVHATTTIIIPRVGVAIVPGGGYVKLVSLCVNNVVVLSSYCTQMSDAFLPSTGCPDSQ